MSDDIFAQIRAARKKEEKGVDMTEHILDLAKKARKKEGAVPKDGGQTGKDQPPAA